MIYAPGFSVTKGRGTTGSGQQEEKGKVRRGEGRGLKRPLLILLIARPAFLRPSPRNSSFYPPSNLVQGNLIQTMYTDVKEPRINYFSKNVNQWKPKYNSKKSVNFYMEISQKREYMLHFEIIISNLQLGWKREQSGVRSTWKPAGAYSGVVDFSVTSYRLALLLTAVIDHWHFLTSMCWFHAPDLSLVRPTPPTGETTEGICYSLYIVLKLQCFNLANWFA